MPSKEFHLGTILSITTGRLLSPDGIGGVYEILNYMTGDNLFTHQLPRASRECEPWLLRQHPRLDSGEMQFAIGELIEMLKTPSGSAEPDLLAKGWLAKQTAIYGETLPVEPIPADDHERIHPLDELERMAPGKTVVVVTP